jgi:uncharacterized protein (DUF885 family)
VIRRHLVPLALVTVAACSPSPAAVAPPAPSASAPSPPMSSAPLPSDPHAAADAQFAALSARFLKAYLAALPTDATDVGDHDFDAQWPDLSEQGDAARRSLYESTRSELAAIPKDALSDQSRVDAAILETRIAEKLFRLDELNDAVQSARSYTTTIGDGIDPLLTREFAPLADRMKSLRARLAGVPPIVAVAKKRLGRPSRIDTETAIKQTRGLVALCEKELAETFAKVPDQKADLEAAAKIAAASLRELGTFFEKELLPRSDGSFRVGKDRHQKLLRFTLDDDSVDGDALAAEARALLDKTIDEMVDTSKEIWPELMKTPMPKIDTPKERRAFVRKVLDKLADDRPDNATIVSEAEKLLDSATAFVREHDLVRVPDEKCRVIEMPEYRRGVTVAYCDSTKPLEKKQESFYAIAPTPSDWPAARVKSFYREYNRSMLADLTVHEAMPGHYLQAMHSSRFHSDVRSLFDSGPFVEGWAVYGEWLMAKNGFGGPKVRMQRLKMLARVAANAILDHGMHAGTMDEKEALRLMTEDAFQEEGEAFGKWTRARLTSAQLSHYFYGFNELFKLRQKMEARPGFTDRAYHDKLLSFGSPPIRHLRALVAGDEK